MSSARRFKARRRMFRPRHSLRRLARRRPHGRGDWFRAAVISLIAGTSLVGAAVTWAAADVSAQASEYDGRHLRELAQLEQIETRIDAIVAYDESLFSTYRAHMRAWGLLRDEAAAVELDDPVLFQRLTLEAVGHAAAARGMRPLFRAYLPPLRDESDQLDEHPAYDREAAVKWLELTEPRLDQLDPDALQAVARRLRSTSIELIAVAIGLVAALFLLTLAQLVQGRARMVLAAMGAVVSLTGAGVAAAVWLVLL